MASPFFRTMRSVESERSQWTWVCLAAILTMLGAWTAWMHAARVSVHVATTNARLERTGTAHRGAASGSVLPGEGVHAVAFFSPSDALGRIVPGQKARIVLDGLAWTQRGILRGEVSAVASEPHEGSIRVDLAMEPESAAQIPAQHGMPGAVEIEVERVSPFALLLRGVAPRGWR